jgi:hypothetical protein
MTVVLPDFDVPADAIDFGNPETWPEDDLEREAMFAKMRREKPVSFHSGAGVRIVRSRARLLVAREVRRRGVREPQPGPVHSPDRARTFLTCRRRSTSCSAR